MKEEREQGYLYKKRGTLARVFLIIFFCLIMVHIYLDEAEKKKKSDDNAYLCLMSKGHLDKYPKEACFFLRVYDTNFK